MSARSHDAGALADFAAGSQLEFEAFGERVLLCSTPAGIFAVQAMCSHALKPLCGGKVRGGRLLCPHHGAAFELRDGSALSAPARRPLKTYPVRIEDGRVLVDFA